MTYLWLTSCFIVRTGTVVFISEIFLNKILIYICFTGSSNYMDVDAGASDTLNLGLGKQTEFDRRKKKK